MDLLFLGTSSGTPTRSRNVSGLALTEETGKRWYLVDCGEATQHQLLRTPLSLHDLSAIFITHVHGDHCYGLPGLLASAGMSGRREPLEIMAPQGIKQWVDATLTMSRTHLPFDLVFHATEQLGEWRNSNLRAQAIELSHRVPSYGYCFTEARPDPRLDVEKLDREGVPRGHLWGRLARGHDVEFEGRALRSDDFLIFNRKPRRIVVGGDNDTPELLNEVARSAQVLVHEATYTQEIAERGKADFGHSTACAVASFAESISVPNLVLTHFSARYQANPERSPSIADIHTEASGVYSGRLFLAEDFARYRLGRDGCLERYREPARG
ncbi:RNAse Z [Halopseudomonas xinjiangensis]|uniref:Ribonuclease Z n=1 Tax=Halopseudomonas xinjiangensis TaxID=487184 RepID=A0A1H1T7C0_9GAMM|nr:ribonuclease Z [Halopseudomonas xinjiangensis]SDS56063.1 RNAse Z [Halopseudomonas xinjiangensis]